MKKISLGLILVLVLTLMFSCARVDAGPMENLVGTYQLTEYYRTSSKSIQTQNDEGETEYTTEENKEDFLANKKIEAYLVVTGNDIGYLSYKDSENGLTVREVKLEYTYDTENTSYISTIRYSLQNDTTGIKVLYGGWSLGFLDREHGLNISDPNYKTTGSCSKGTFSIKEDSRDHVYFKRVSRDTDTKYISDKYGDIKVISYALGELSDVYAGVLYYNDKSAMPTAFADYIFWAIEFNSERTLATTYYATREGKEIVKKENLPVSVEYTEDKLKIKSIVLDGVTFNYDYSLYYKEGEGENEKTLFIYPQVIDDFETYGNNYIQEYINYASIPD